MSILSGFFKTIKYRLTDSGYKWQSEKTSSQTVVMGDGTNDEDTLEKRLGGVKGLTTSTSVTSTGYAWDATCGKKVTEDIATLNESLRTEKSKTAVIGTHSPMTVSECSVPTHTDTVIKEFKLKAGTWIVTYNLQFPSNNIGYRQAYIDTANVCADVRDANDSANTGTGMDTLSGTTVFTSTTDISHKIHVIQNSGVTLKVNGYINAVRIK